MRCGLCLENLRIFLHDKLLIGPLDLQIGKGEIVTIMGASGSGKTTVLHAIAGVLAAPFTWQGTMFLDGQNIATTPTHLRQIGLMFQDDLLFEHMTIGQNLLFGLKSHKDLLNSARMERLHAALQSAELPDVADHYPTQLSGGQRSRISLMRTLLYEPRCMLMDEPFSALDTALRGRMRAFVKQQLHIANIPAIIVTHDIHDHEDLGGTLFSLTQDD
ncbi:MAG: ATP-binding cassette domain-containing protein [Pseudomonadota bacterium]